jgi:sec-independent protein translocase protein TatC
VIDALVAASKSPDETLVKLIWQSIPRERQVRLAEWAQTESISPQAARQMRQDLTWAWEDCLDSQSLATAAVSTKALHSLDADQRVIAQSMQDFLRREPSDDTIDRRRMTRQINRILLACAFPDAILLPQPELVELTIWETGHARIQTLGVPEAFMAWVKAWLVLTVLVSSPWIFYQIWMFVASGLYGHERKLVYAFLPFSLALFLAGAALAFVFVFDPVLDFLFEFNRKLQIDIEPRFNDWMGFVLLLPLGFGVAFQLPLVMLAVERLGILTIDSYVSRWRFAVLGIFVISMLLTPADPISMLLMAIPLTFLYFGGILLCRLVPRPKLS